MTPPATLEAPPPARARGNSTRHGEPLHRSITVSPPASEAVTAIRVTFTPEVSALLLRKAGECGVTPYQLINAIIGDHLDDYYGHVRPEDDYMSPEEEDELVMLAEEAKKNCTGYISHEELWKGLCPTP